MTNTRPPNILWICTDQQRFDTLGCYGNPHINTPNLDRLAENAVLFEHAYCQSPVCTPSRASFLTGRYPRTTRCRQNGQSIPPDEILVTQLLAEAGYSGGLSGKLHLSACHPQAAPLTERRIRDGYAEFHWSHTPLPSSVKSTGAAKDGYAAFHWSHDTGDHWPMNEYQLWLREQGVRYQRVPFQGSKHVQVSMPAEYHQTTWCAQKAITFMAANAPFDRPWFFSVNPFDPHHPFDPPEEYLQRYLDRLANLPLPNYVEGELDNKPIYQQIDHQQAYNNPNLHQPAAMSDDDHRLVRAAYYAMIELIDDQVGRMLDALEVTGQLENTLVIFMSDHGEMLGDHGLYLKGPYFYEPAVRVPLLISWPGVIKGGQRSQALVELTDLAPTLLEAAGLAPHAGMQGRSLLPLLTGQTDLNRHRDDIYCEYYNAMPWHNQPTAQMTMVRTDRHKLVVAHGLETGELYDLVADPYETTNLWAEPSTQSLKLALFQRLADRMAWTVDPLPRRETNW
jgi:arylsulfatase A-like enzyme